MNYLEDKIYLAAVITIIFIIIFTIPTYAAETIIQKENYTQVDYKANLDRGSYGSVEHSIEMIDKISTCNDFILTYLTIRDDTSHSNYIYVTDINGVTVNKYALGSSYSVDGKFYELKDKSGVLLFTKYNNSSNSIKQPTVIYIDCNGNVIGKYNYSNASKSVGSKKAIAEDDKYVYYAMNSNTYYMYVLLIDKASLKNNVLKVTGKTYSPTSANDSYSVYSNGKEIYILYDLYNKKTANEYYLYKYDINTTYMDRNYASRANIWPYNGKNIIQNVYPFEDYILVQANDGMYKYDFENNEFNPYIEENDIESKMYFNNLKSFNFENSNTYKLNDGKYELEISYVKDTNKMTVASNNDTCTFDYKNEIEFIYHGDSLELINGSNHVYVYMDHIEYVKTKAMILNDDKNIYFFSNSLTSNYALIYDKNDEYVKINKINGFDTTMYLDNIYCGTNGLTIEGESKLKNSSQIVLYIGAKTYDAIIQDNTFKIAVPKEELNEGLYDECYIEIKNTNSDLVYFDELELGTEFYYDNVLYTKIDSDLGYEKYTEDHYTIIRLELLEKSEEELKNYLTDEEYAKYRDYIYDNKMYEYWLSSGNIVFNGNLAKLTSKNKNYSAYIRFKKHIDLDETFRFNDIDGKYYSCNSTDIIKVDLNNVKVSYEDCKMPNVYILPEDKYTDKPFKIIAEFENSEDILKIEYDQIDINNEIKKYEIDVEKDECKIEGDKLIYEKVFKDDAKYYFSCYTYNLYGNSSKRIELDIIKDSTSPEIVEIKNELKKCNDKYYSKNDKVKYEIIYKDLTGLDTQIGDNLFSKGIYLENDEQLTVDIVDKLNNKIEVPLIGEFIVDKNKPIIDDVDVAYQKDKVVVTVKATDDIGVECIKYQVNDREFEILNDEVVLNRKFYDRDTKFRCIAYDIAGNESEIYECNINLNDAPLINIDDFNKHFDMANMPRIKVYAEDDDNDELILKIYVDSLLIYSNRIDKAQTINLENYYTEFEDKDYKKNIKLTFELSDGLESDIQSFDIVKDNMKPLVNVATKKINFDKVTQLDIETYDFDNDKMKLKISSNNNVVFEKECANGLEHVMLYNKLPCGNNDLKIEVYDGENVTRINKHIEVKKLDIGISDDIDIIKISNDYTNEFYGYIENNINYKLLIFNDVNSSFDNGIDIYNIDKDMIINNNVLYINGEITDEDVNKILSYFNDEELLVIPTNDEIFLSDIYLYDYENDYSDYERKAGQDRKIIINYDPLKFENATSAFSNEEYIDDNYHYQILYPGEYDLKLSEKDYLFYKDIDYSKKSDDKNIKIISHNIPYCKLDVKEKIEEDKLILDIHKEAYDKDFISLDNGISYMKFTIKDLSMLEEIYISENRYDEKIELNASHDYSLLLYVLDYGINPETCEYSFSNACEYNVSRNSINPYGEINYMLDNDGNLVSSDDYVYVYENSENLIMNVDVFYNDIFKEDGTHYYKTTYDNEELKNEIMNCDTVKNDLYVENKYGNKYETSKDLNVYKLEIYNNTKLDYDNIDGFKNACDLNFEIEVNNMVNENDISLYIDDKYIMNNESNKYSFVVDDDYILDKLSDMDFEDDYILLPFVIYVYSNRDDSYLGRDTFFVKYYSNEEILDFKITNVFDKTLKLNMPVSICDMPIGDIKKGYAFEYEIDTKNMRDDDYEIVIDVNYYYLDKNKNVFSKIELNKNENGKIIKYDYPILYNDIEIGMNDKIILSSFDKTILTDKEVWHGIYYIPYDAIVILDDEIKKDGYILVNFDIKAYKNNNFVYSFNDKKWNKKNLNNNNSGDTAIYSIKRSILDDYREFGIY